MGEICTRWGMKISAEKTKILVLRGASSAEVSLPTISICDEPIEVVEHAKYLGAWYSADCSLEKNLSKRIGAATGAAMKLQYVWRSKEISLKTKILFYKTAVLTILLHGAESWSLTAQQVKQLETFQQRWLRSILGLSWRSHTSHAEVCKQASVDPIEIKIRQIRMFWLGHVVRMGPSRLPHRMLFSQLAGPRRVGTGNLTTLGRVYYNDILTLNGGVVNGLSWLQCAHDRAAWTRFVTGTSAGDPGPSQPVPAPSASGAAPTSEPPASEINAGEAPATESSEPGELHSVPLTSPRLQRRMGLTPTEPLLAGVPDRRPYNSPAGPYRGRPRGRPPLPPGQRQTPREYVPTGRPRGRPPKTSGRGAGRGHSGSGSSVI